MGLLNWIRYGEPASTTIWDMPKGVNGLLEQRRRTYLDTERTCATAGFKFCPMIFEEHGGMSSALRSAMDWIAKAGASVGNDSQTTWSLRTAQRISCSLQREPARSVLRRRVPDQAAVSVQQIVVDQVDAGRGLSQAEFYF